MPELPEVETVRRYLERSGAVRAPLLAVDVRWPPMLSGVTPMALQRSLKGRWIERVDRRGKWLQFIWNTQQTLLVHLRMTGNFILRDAGDPPAPHDRAILYFKGVQLHFHDTRKFGRWIWTDCPERFLNHLGPEPLASEWAPEEFYRQLKKTRRCIKSALLDQSVVAGLGNIYADESLFRAGIHPQRRADRIAYHRVRLLHAAVREVLADAIRMEGTSLGGGLTNFRQLYGQPGKNQPQLNVYGRNGSSCPACGGTIRRRVLGQRSTCYCPQCQH